LAADSSRAPSVVDRAGTSPLTINRLSIYLRSLRTLEARGIARISSRELAQLFHLSPTQIRKDLAQFGEFGVRGVGYDVTALAQKLTHLLGLDVEHRVVIVGVGNLGTALVRFPAFNSDSFRVVGAVDSDPAKRGRKVGRLQIAPMSLLRQIVATTRATLAILAVPAEAAPSAYEAAARAGVTAVLNFAPVSLPSISGCRVKNVDLRIQLEELSFYLSTPAPDPVPSRSNRASSESP
jgi:redox-sensing transcriptional repressor